MGIFKNLFKNDEDALSIINTKKATDEINAKAFELANKLKSMLISIGCTNEIIELNGVKLRTVTLYHNENNITETTDYIGILSKDDEVFLLNIDKPIPYYNSQTEKYDTFYPTSFGANKCFLEHADGIFNEVRTMQEKHEKDCSNILESVKDL